MRKNRLNSQAGITLIEVLISVLILGTSVATLLSLLSLNARNTVFLENSMLARIVAENAMVEVITLNQNRQTRDEGATVEIDGREFRWSVEREPFQIEGLETLKVSVTDAETDQLLAELSTLKRQ